MNQNAYSNIKFLKEIQTTATMPFHVMLVSIDEMPIHMHNGEELIFVLKGSVRIKISFNNYVLKMGEFLLINRYEVHKIESTDEDNLILIMQLGEDLMRDTLFVFDPYYYQTFHQDKVKDVCNLMADSYLICQNSEDQGGMVKIEEMISQITATCIEYFQMQQFDASNQTVSPYIVHTVNNTRIKNTYQYMYFNYTDKIRLTDVAHREHIDKSYASRLLKDGMGANFQDVINTIRVDRAELLLLGTDTPIQEITEQLGFSSYYYFTQQFKQYFQLTPSAYRKKYSGQIYPYRQMDYCLIDFNQAQMREAMNRVRTNMTRERTLQHYYESLFESYRQIYELQGEALPETITLPNGVNISFSIPDTLINK